MDIKYTGNSVLGLTVAFIGVLAMATLCALLTIVPWALGIAQIWNSFFG